MKYSEKVDGYATKSPPQNILVGEAKSNATIEEGVDLTFGTTMGLLELARAINSRLKNQNTDAKPSGTPVLNIVDKTYFTNNILQETHREIEEIARTIFR